MSHLVWYEIFKWLGVVVIMPSNVMTLFACFIDSARNMKLRKWFLLVWHTVVWLLWSAGTIAYSTGRWEIPPTLWRRLKFYLGSGVWIAWRQGRTYIKAYCGLGHSGFFIFNRYIGICIHILVNYYSIYT
jgi:hypothetical protein